MNIGFFGDSYVDITWYRYRNPDIPYENKIWAQRLLEELNAPFLCSGLGGSSQYYAISEWNNFSKYISFDVAIFTFTWAHRIYTNPKNENVVRAYIEGRHVEASQEEEVISDAIEKYMRHLYNKEESNFTYELMVKWCLELPKQYPNTKFIFLPNTRDAQEIAKKYFTQGILVDFAFEELSLREGERVGVAPMIMDRIGHLSSNTHEQVKDMVKDIILNYNDCVYPVDYNNFNLKNLYPGYYDNK